MKVFKFKFMFIIERKIFKIDEYFINNYILWYIVQFMRININV